MRFSDAITADRREGEAAVCRVTAPHQRYRLALMPLGLGVMLLLSGCLEQPPMLASGYGSAGSAGRHRQTKPPLTAAGVATVRPGDTAYSFARRNNVPLRALIELNRLQPPYALRAGQQLSLPALEVYRVSRGDTLYGISRNLGVDMYAVAQANGIAPPYHIRSGQTLVIPAASAPVPHTRPDANPASSPPSVAVAAAEDTRYPPPHQTAPPQAPAVAAIVPPTPAPPRGHEEPSAPRESAPAPVAPATAAAPSPSTAAESPPPPATEPAAGMAQETSLPLPPPVAVPPALDDNGRFLWPARGRLISHFGIKEGGLQNDGVNIAVPVGTPVRAAESGEVVYAGNELRGYGNLLLLRHNGGFMTAYAHIQDILVQRGDKVTRGQIIAHSGATGSVSSPQLHFEIRRGAQPVDPLPFLQQSAGARGAASKSVVAADRKS